MSKNIVFCADGTWDAINSRSNVYRLYSALPTNAKQFPFYDDGVGSEGLMLDRFAEGAFGLGLFQKIKDGYVKLAHVYEQDDDVFVFGFSRGAYVARSLAGMIAVCGLPTKNWDDNLVETAFEAYRNRQGNRKELLRQLADCSLYNAKIKCVGVWDTVGSLGIPALIGGIDPIAFGFLDTCLHEDVLNAFHAVSIDERRREFPATLWTGPFAASQRVEQVWFSGVHCDVGGGYCVEGSSSQGLADITLAWMMSKASECGLILNPDRQREYALPFDAKYALSPAHESWSLLWGFPCRRTIPRGSCLADSVVVRCQHHDAWASKNVELQNGLPAPHYTIAHVVGSGDCTASS